MVSADNLNLDVLELIFTLLCGNDLSSVALVSRSFLAGVIPKLYETISYRLKHGKGYELGKVMSPFASVLAHRHLAVHVRNIELRAIPTTKGKPHPVFVRECRETIRLCKNLKLFKCTVPNCSSLFLPSLQPRLEDLRLSANLTSQQARILLKLDELQSLTLQFASWNVVDILPSWTEQLQRSMANLTLFMINELNEEILRSTLTHLPRLTGLHVVGCPKTDHTVVLRVVSQTPMLQSLSFTTTENTKPLNFPPPPLHDLRNLSLDARYCMMPASSPAILASLLSHLKLSSPPLTTFTLKLPEHKVTVGEPFISQLVGNHGRTLRHLTFWGCHVSLESISEICKSCVHLDRLDITIPMRDIDPLAQSLSHSTTLQTLMDIENHDDHGVRQSLGQHNAKSLMLRCPSLKKIITACKIWNGRPCPKDGVYVSVERHHSRSYGSLWFMPRE